MLLTNAITKGQDGGNELSTTISVSASSIDPISISEKSAIIGINRNNEKPGNITLKFNGSMSHELINVNKGVIAGIDIEGLEMTKTSASVYFAPIMVNYGVISQVNFKSIKVKGLGCMYVSGMVNFNESTGIITNCSINNSYIYSLYWVCFVYYDNMGIMSNTSASEMDYSGNLVQR